MKRKGLLSLVGSICLILVLAALLLPACAPAEEAPEAAAPTPEAKYTWRAVSIFPPADIGFTIFRDTMNDISAKSGGRIEIASYAAGELIPGEEVHTAIHDGIIEMGMTTAQYFPEECPLGLIDSGGVPFAWLFTPEVYFDGDQLASGHAWFNMVKETGIWDMLKESYGAYDLYLWGELYCNGYPGLYTQVPIRTVDDLDGLVIYALAGNATVYEAFGAATLDVPLEECYMAMKLGTIDSISYDIAGMFAMKWWEVTNYYTIPTFCSPSPCGAFLNMDVWNSLPKDLQDVIEESGEAMWDDFCVAYEKLTWEVLDRQEECGYEVNVLPDEEFMKLYEVAKAKVWPEFAALGPDCAKALELIDEWYTENPDRGRRPAPSPWGVVLE